MKTIFFFTALMSSHFFVSSPTGTITPGKAGCELGITINKTYSKSAALDSILKHYTTNALPGAAVAIYSEAEGWWADAQGYSSIERKTPMENCHLQYIQSVSKSYMAVEILQLKEQGKINFENAITKYLPERYSRYINEAEKVTVRMLLNHTSGIPEYNENPAFLSQVMLHPLEFFTAEDCLKSIANEPLKFTPGSKYVYTNTNYLLLSLIADSITGNHAAYIKEHIFKPLSLNNSYYGNDHNYIDETNLPDTYWDVFNNGKPVNISKFQEATVVSSKGDDGIVCTPTDAVKYLKGLMEGKLLKPESMKEMFDFVTDEKGRKRYG
ncbi:MAG: serine hydrolase domain-containing protein, partial [Panacibacter sp.]